MAVVVVEDWIYSGLDDRAQDTRSRPSDGKACDDELSEGHAKMVIYFETEEWVMEYTRREIGRRNNFVRYGSISFTTETLINSLCHENICAKGSLYRRRTSGWRV